MNYKELVEKAAANRVRNQKDRQVIRAREKDNDMLYAKLAEPLLRYAGCTVKVLKPDDLNPLDFNNWRIARTAKGEPCVFAWSKDAKTVLGFFNLKPPAGAQMLVELSVTVHNWDVTYEVIGKDGKKVPRPAWLPPLDQLRTAMQG
jgi:hypothetical protein